jgi:hypothetical protein
LLRNNFDQTRQFGFSNNFELIWNIIDGLQFNGRFGISKTSTKQTIFKSPFHTDYINSTKEEQGSYARSQIDQFNYNVDGSVAYGKLIDDIHLVSAIAGFSFAQSSQELSTYRVNGFIDEDYPNPNFALGHLPGTRPDYMEAKNRRSDFFMNGHYGYDGRYMLDFNYRLDGTSIFGSSKRFANTWAVGLAWNIHKEAFMDGLPIDNLRLRASIGNPGRQNFDDYIAILVYRYALSNPNVFGPGNTVDNFGNPGLDWQKTIDKNIGLDLGMFGNRLRVIFDLFQKDNDPMLVPLGMPSSVGVSRLPRNLGRLINNGATITINYAVISTQDVDLWVNAAANTYKYEYANIGNALDKLNTDNYGTSLLRYRDGASPYDLWAMRSQGIDPASGREIFVRRDGTPTFLYDYKEEVVVGNSDPDLNGTLGMSFRYKNLSMRFDLRYRIGGQAFMNALYDKVENIYFSNGDGMTYTDRRYDNMDRRALYDRWQKPGDDARFKAIWLPNESQYMSSRFVMDNNVITGESLNLSYETQAVWLRRIGAQSLTLSAYMNDFFHASTIRNERSTEYPFAGSVSFSVGLRF